jgi:hypothetical protein
VSIVENRLNFFSMAVLPKGIVAYIAQFYLRIKAWIHPPVGKTQTPELIKLLKQPGEQE